MSADWYYSEGSERRGPVTEAELRRLADDGQLNPTDLVWCDGMGMTGWVEAKTVQALFPKKEARRRPAEEDDPPPRRSFDVDRPSRRGGQDDEYEEDERPSRRGKRRDERDELDDDDDRPRVRRQTDDYEDEYDERPRSRKNQKPSQIQAVGVMMLIGGILGILAGLSMIGYFGLLGAATGGPGCICCIWPGMYLELVWGILATIRGVNMMNRDDQGPPKTLLILQIICIINGDVINCVLGIVGLVMLGDEQVQKYYRRKGFY